jgi:protein O-GlcNAc transferase
MQPRGEDLFKQALSSLQKGNASDAERQFNELLRQSPRHIAGLNLLCILLTRLGRYQEAEPYAQRAIDACATSDATFHNYGIILRALKRPQEAVERFGQAVAINDRAFETWNGRGAAFNDCKRYSEAIADFDRALSLNPNYAEAYANKALSLARLGSSAEALTCCDRAVSLDPALAEAWITRGTILLELGHLNDAMEAFNKALAVNQTLALGWLGRGDVLFAQHHDDAALTSYEKAVAISPGLAAAWLGCGNVSIKQRRYDEAFAAYDKAVAADPELDHAEGLRLFAKLTMCDWTDLDAYVASILQTVRTNKHVVPPYPLFCIPSTAADQLACAKRNLTYLPPFRPLWRGETYSHDRIRVAYLSSDLHDHATAHLMAGLFEAHDRSRFDVHAVSFGPDDQSEMRLRLRNAFEHFEEASGQSDAAIAEQLRRQEIDIAIDLKGFMQDARPGIFARRAAPVQVNYLGQPGTLGADFIDYIIADKTVIPAEQFEFYSERIVWLPDSYQANDIRRRISDSIPTREECGLPRSGFVFCCFNNTIKIGPEIFDVWMRLLAAVDGSVLWLIDGNAIASENLRREAEKRGIAASRLVFAPRTPSADHLARHRQADLFLDCLHYNAHTTASDSLWAEVPLLTMLGQTFAGRVAASLLKAVGLPELITTSLPEYEAMALKLARDPVLLASLKAKLASNRKTFPLFDTERFARHIEAAYLTMWEWSQRGEMPVSFSVPAIQ